MEDRELLEMAAKAAGHEWRWYGAPLGPLFQIKTHNGIWIFWDPLSSDGDALRLAVKLGMMIDCSNWTAINREKVDGAWTDGGRDNPLAATRRAIVLAAAEIGKLLA